MCILAGKAGPSLSQHLGWGQAPRSAVIIAQLLDLRSMHSKVRSDHDICANVDCWACCACCLVSCLEVTVWDASAMWARRLVLNYGWTATGVPECMSQA